MKKYLDPENMKKPPIKAHNRLPIFFMYWSGCSSGPETEMPHHQKPLNAGLGIQTGNQPFLISKGLLKKH